MNSDTDCVSFTIDNENITDDNKDRNNHRYCYSYYRRHYSRLVKKHGNDPMNPTDTVVVDGYHMGSVEQKRGGLGEGKKKEGMSSSY